MTAPPSPPRTPEPPKVATGVRPAVPADDGGQEAEVVDASVSHGARTATDRGGPVEESQQVPEVPMGQAGDAPPLEGPAEEGSAADASRASGSAEGGSGPGGSAGGGPVDGVPVRESSRAAPFEVHLTNFEGPFDLLLQLISKHQLDVTEIALSRVTDEFIAHINAAGSEWDLGQATEFLVVAATLLDLKAARLLPSAEVEDEEDLALLEARDLLFARLLQYRAYKEVAAFFRELEGAQARRHPRAVSMEPRYASLLPEVLLGIGPDQFAQLAVRAMTPKKPPTVSIDHVHAPRVSVREHAAMLRERLARVGSATFRSLVHDCQHTLEVVARFLALLELYREAVLAFEQLTPLGELHVRWTGPAGGSGAENPDAPDTGDADMDEEYG